MSDRFHHPSRHMVVAPADARHKSYHMATNDHRDDDQASTYIVPSSPLVMPGAPRLRSIPLPYVPAEALSGYATPPLSPLPSPSNGLLPLPSYPQDVYTLPRYGHAAPPSWQSGVSSGSNSLGLSIPHRDVSGTESSRFWNYQESYWPIPDSNYDEAGSSLEPFSNTKHRISRSIAGKEVVYEGADQWDQLSESDGGAEEVQHFAHRVRRKRPAESSASFQRAHRRSARDVGFDTRR